MYLSYRVRFDFKFLPTVFGEAPYRGFGEVGATGPLTPHNGGYGNLRRCAHFARVLYTSEVDHPIVLSSTLGSCIGSYLMKGPRLERVLLLLQPPPIIFSRLKRLPSSIVEFLRKSALVDFVPFFLGKQTYSELQCDVVVSANWALVSPLVQIPHSTRLPVRHKMLVTELVHILLPPSSDKFFL
jgi:hypothetical protein